MTEPISSTTWDEWYLEQLSMQLVGVASSTSRAKIVTVGIASASVTKSALRAEEVELTLQIEGHHKKEAGGTVSGLARVKLGRKEDGHDYIKVVSVRLGEEGEASPFELASSLDEVEFAAKQTLSSALLERLNHFLWDVEKRSLDEL